MLNLALILPGFMVVVASFHFTYTFHHLSTTFASLSPAVIEASLMPIIEADKILWRLNEDTTTDVITTFFANHLTGPLPAYVLEIDLWNLSPDDPCTQLCTGVSIKLSTFVFSREMTFQTHYKLYES